MYERVIYRFFDETPSLIEEASQEDEESKTYSRMDTNNKFPMYGSMISKKDSAENTPKTTP